MNVSTIIFNNRYLVKHMLLFCGIDDRVSCSYLNRIFNQEYKCIIPSTRDAKALLDYIIIMVHSSPKKSNSPVHKFPDHKIIADSYLSDRIIIKDTVNKFTTSLTHERNPHELKISIMHIQFEPGHTNIIYWCGDHLEIMNSNDLNDDSKITDYAINSIFKCTLISMLNNLLILIKKGSSKLYGKNIIWTREGRHEWGSYLKRR